MENQRAVLSSFPYREELIKIIKANQVIILVGAEETGKTTQVPVYLKDAGFCEDGKKIGCTQPKRLSAITASNRVAQELGTEVGNEVGYSIRFEDRTSEKTVIKFMTDGLLLRELLGDPNLNTYSVVIIDEVQERTLNTDLLLGLSKNIIKLRPDLKLVISMTTSVNAARLSKFFDDAPIFSIPGPTEKSEPDNHQPEVQNGDLTRALLLLKSLGQQDLTSFPFLDAPPQELLDTALEQLTALGALDWSGDVTTLGRKMVLFPLDPMMAKMLIASEVLGCSSEILTLAALLSVPGSIFQRADDKPVHGKAREKFFSEEGDHLTLLNVYNWWAFHKYSEKWCQDHSIQPKFMQRAKEIRTQLEAIMKKEEIQIASGPQDTVSIRKAITSGYFSNAARKTEDGNYTVMKSKKEVKMHPDSALFAKPPAWVVFHEVGKEYMRHVLEIESSWVAEAAPGYFKEKEPK